MRGSGHRLRRWLRSVGTWECVAPATACGLESTSAVRFGSVDGWRLAVMVLDGFGSEAHMPKPEMFLIAF